MIDTGMIETERAKTAADATLRAYEYLGRRLPADVTTWTTNQHTMMRNARDAYYSALRALNKIKQDRNLPLV